MSDEANPSYLYSLVDVPKMKQLAEFEELTGGEMKVTSMPLTSVDKNGVAVTKYYPGVTTYAPITLMHALTLDGQALNDWFEMASSGNRKDALKHLSIFMLDMQGKPKVVWDLTNALPIGISGFSFNQYTKGGLYYVCHELTIQVERIEMSFQ